MSYQHIAKEIADDINARWHNPPDYEILVGIIAARIKSLVEDAERFKFIEGVLARTIGFHGEKSEWVVDEFRLFGVTFRDAIDNAMEKGHWGCGGTA